MSRGLSNDGLIDGQYTRISAASLSNRGRIYGDTVAIRAGELVNTAGAQGGAVIASRGSLDLGIGSLVNERHALIYSAADLRIGGALDAAGRAVGQALRLLNTGATIEAGGDARIAVTQLMNLNANYTSETVTQAPVGKLFVRPDGSSARYDMTDNWFCVNDRPRCGKEVALLENDSQHGFLMPSDAYPASRYGPPFDYAPWYVQDGARGKEVPIAPIRVPQLTVCREVEGSQVCGGQNDTGETLPWYRPLVHDYAVDAKIWKVFGVTPPSDPAPRWAPRDCGRDRQCMAAETVRRQEYETAFAAFQAPYAELDRRIRAFNADYARRMSYRFTIYEVDELVTETRTLTSDPGRILSGGAMTLAGAVTNDKSQIAAGGALVARPGHREHRRAGPAHRGARRHVHVHQAQRQQPAPPLLGD